MSAFAVPFRQLVERRLWPLAVLLIAALVAVPVLLAKGEEPVIPGPVASAASAPGTASALATQPIVSIGDEATREAQRKVLGKRKNPFRPAVAPKKATMTDVAGTKPNLAGGKAESDAGGKLPGAGGVALEPAVQVPHKVYEVHSLTVRFGASSAEKLNRRNLKRLTALPSIAMPTIIYLGLLSDEKTAVFLVDAAADVQGDGKCNPTPDNCQTLHLKPGETAFFDITAGEGGALMAQYQLDFVKVKVSKTTDAKAARAARLAVSSGGREVLRHRKGRAAGYTYDPVTGTVRTPKQSRRAAVSVSQETWGD